jgi:diguanylate cyclase (GGDEF)-like protein
VGLAQEAKTKTVKFGELFVGWVAKEKKALLVKDIELEYPEISLDLIRKSRYSTKSFLIVPVKTNDRLIGVLSLTDRHKAETVFHEEDFTALMVISDHFALHIENIRLRGINQNLATLDPLTSLANHRFLHEQLLEEIYRAERYRSALSIILFDIDDFSRYNQTFGYQSGDSALKQIATIIKDNIRKTDILSRYGGQEFAVVLPESNLKKAVFVAEKIREKIEAAIFTENRKSSLGMSRLTLSAGVALHKPGLTKEELISNALSALEEAKRKGKDRVSSFH